MKTLITRIKRLALALCFVTPLVSWAATTVGYEDFGDVAGVQLWRTATGSGVQDFAFAKFAAVAADGTVGDTYTQDTSAATHWRRWASKFQGGSNSYYTAPGLVLVYDQAGLMATPSKGATFAPVSFGGLWVKELGANDTPYGLTDEANKGRATEFGATGNATLFKFEKSFTINRGAASTFYGTATVNITGDAVFTASTGYATVVDADATLKLTGDSTAAMSVGTGLTVNGTLDLTASTLPTISGNVTLSNGSSLVLPEGTATGAEISVAVCSGTLTADGVVSVKIGSADPINAALTISGGTITQIDETVVEQTYTSEYPSVVPAGYIYTFKTSEAPTLPDVTVNGTLKTEGDFTITDLKVAAGGTLEVVSGNTTVGGAADCQIKGNVTVDAGATLTNTRTDSLDYNGTMTVDVSGTLAMGSTRWSIPSSCTFNLRGGASVTGTGDTLASLDIINANGQGLNVYAGTSPHVVTIEGPVRVRANETRIWVASGTTLVLQSGIVEKNQQPGSFKQTGPGTLEICATQTGLTGGTSTFHQGTLRLNNTTTAIPLAFNSSAALEIVATDAATTVPVNVTSIYGNGVTLTGSGKANGSITKTAEPGGDLATFLQSSAWEGTFVADWAGANGTRFDINSYGNANSTVRVTKLVGGYVSGSNANVTVVPTVEVSAGGFMTLDNGYSGKITTLTKLTGSGVFTNKTYSVDVTTLDNFTGTLATLIGKQYLGMQIGTINLSATPAAGAKIVNITSDSNIGNIEKTKVSVNGVVDDTIALEVKSDGIYVAVPVATVDITIPEVDNATVSVTADGVAVTPVNGVVTVEVGSAVVVTYTADEGYQLTGDAISFTASASTTTVDVSNISVAAIVANVTSADGQTTTPYTSAASAIAEADDGETVTLLETTVTLTQVVEINKSITILSGNASGTIITGVNTSVYPTLGEADLTLGANVTVNTQLRVLSAGATITHPTGKAPSYRPPNGYTSSSKNNGDDTTTITFYKQVLVIAAGTNATLADENGNPLGSMTQVASGDTFVFTVTPAAGCALVRVTADSVELTPSEGKYSISIGSSNVSIYAVAGAAVVTGGDSDEYCTSLQAAVEAAESGNTVKLLADVALNSTLTLPAGKTLTMDLGGFTIYSGNDSSKRIVVNGTVTMTNGVVDGQTTVYDPNNGTAMIRVNGSLTLGANLTIRNTINAVAAFGTGSLTVNGATINALGFAISTNGSATGDNASNGTVLAINSGTITSTDVAVYLPSGTMTINGGTITGSTGVYAKGGSLSVPSTSTAVITGNGANAGWSYNGDGANSTGDALVIDNSAYPYGPATATIAGGTYESTNGDAIGNYTKDAETLPTATGFVTGGTFSSDVSAFCAPGYTAVEEDGVWTGEALPVIAAATWDGSRTATSMFGGYNPIYVDPRVTPLCGKAYVGIASYKRTGASATTPWSAAAAEGVTVTYTLAEGDDAIATINGDEITFTATGSVTLTATLTESSGAQFDKIATITCKTAVAEVNDTVYGTLSDALKAAGNISPSAKVSLIGEGAVISGTVSKGDVTLDLAGYTITDTGSTANTMKITVSGGKLTVVNTEAEGGIETANAITAGKPVFTVTNGELVLGTGLTVDATDDRIIAYINPTKAANVATVTVDGATLRKTETATYAVIQGHGNDAGTATVNVRSGLVSTTGLAGMYCPAQHTTVNVTGGTVVGKTGIYVKNGTLNITGGAVEGTGAAVAYKYTSSGFSTTGDALVIDSCGFPGGSATVSVTGGTFTSANGAAVASYAKCDDPDYATVTDYVPVTGFITGGTFDSDPSAYVADGYAATESAGVWTVAAKSGIDPTDPTSKQEVTPSEQEIADAGSAEAAAKAKATVTIPEAVATATGVSAETYKSYFTLSATETSPGSGVYEVAIANLNKDVVFPTTESDDLTADLADVLDVAAGADVEITTAKPGLYYSIEAASNVGFTGEDKVEGARELATTTTVSPKKPAKTGTAVFYRVKVSTTQE